MIWSNGIRLLAVVVLYAAGICLVVCGAWLLGIVLHLLLVVPLLWGTLNPSSRLFGPIQTTTGNDQLWLTLDDGPDPLTTPAILELLSRHRVKATFFVIGEKAERYPGLIREIVAAGHQLANHTWSHPQGTFWCRGPIRTRHEIEACQLVLEKITGSAPRIFRAPVGHHNLFVHPVLKRSGIKLVGWNCRGFDAVMKSSDEVMALIKKQMRPGGIILAHEATEIAVEVVSGIIAHAESQGWSFMDPLKDGGSPRSDSC